MRHASSVHSYRRGPGKTPRFHAPWKGRHLPMDDRFEVRDEDTPEEPETPPDAPEGVNQHGVTAGEQLSGEPLDSRLADEVPEVDFNATDPPAESEAEAGLIVEPESEDQVDTTAEAIGQLVDENELSAEEAAVHVEPETSV